MTFDSAIYLFCFFPVVYILFRLLPGEKQRRGLLIAAGLVFCAFGSLYGVCVLLVSALTDFLAGLLIIRGKRPKAALIAAVIINLGLLCTFKYIPFFAENFHALTGAGLGAWDIAAPLGISFFTFKGISYAADVYRRPETGSRRPMDVLLYVSFFPQFTAGPITRFDQFSQYAACRRPTWEDTALGLRRVIAGLCKKLLIAGTVGKFVDSVYSLAPSQLDWRLCALAAVGYTIQIYFDFSGYSDMAIGLGRMFGFETPENFNYPYSAASISEFWRRWHISLSQWFRDYLYIPLGGNRKGRARAALNKLAVFLLCGLWHGANWTFVLWGAWHGTFAALETIIPGAVGKMKGSLLGRAAGHLYALLAVCLGFAVFRADSVSQGLAIIGGIFSGLPVTAASALTFSLGFTPAVCAAMCAGAVLSVPVPESLRIRLSESSAARGVSYGACVVGFALCIMAMAGGNFAPFIYARF